MITINQVVFNKKNQKGTIKRIITKSTGYVLVAYENGSEKKEMAFNLTDESGKPLRKAPKKSESEPKELSPLEQVISHLKTINYLCYGDRNGLSYQIWANDVYKIQQAAERVGNRFIQDVCESVDRYYKISDKQAYCLAVFAISNNVEF